MYNRELGKSAADNDIDLSGGILADDMGLGKTIQMLGLTLMNPVKRTLIVCPVALMEQWAAQTKRFLGHEPFVFHSVSDKLARDSMSTSPITITSYSTMTSRSSIVSSFEWGRVIFDEAHYLRNPNTEMFLTAYSLSIQHCWLVTGTPVQNRIRDLRSLCTLLGLDVESTTIDQFQELLPSIMLRRTKESAGISLPPLNRQDIIVPWSDPVEKRVARDIHSILSFSNLNEKSIDAIISLLASSHLSAILRMRQICVLPRLLGPTVLRHVRDIDSLKVRENYMRLLGARSKLNAVLQTVRANIAGDHRAMIFCSFRTEMDTLQEELSASGLTVGRIDGTTTSEERIRLLAKDDSAPRILILQIQTACEGLNLQHFDQVYFVAPHWNPAVEDQAIGRAYRIGQERPVSVWRFLMDGFDDKEEEEEDIDAVDEEERSRSIDSYCALVQDRKRELIAELMES